MTVLLPFMHLTPVEDFIRVTGKENDFEKKKRKKNDISVSYYRTVLCKLENIFAIGP